MGGGEGEAAGGDRAMVQLSGWGRGEAAGEDKAMVQLIGWGRGRGRRRRSSHGAVEWVGRRRVRRLCLGWTNKYIITLFNFKIQSVEQNDFV